MKAEIKLVHSPDLMESTTPRDPFCVLVQFLVGPQGGVGQESFDVTVCSPSWLERQEDKVISGEHMIIMKNFSLEEVGKFFAKRVAAVQGDSWTEIALKLSRIARWEFEDY